jgi:hypothetical protein
MGIGSENWYTELRRNMPFENAASSTRDRKNNWIANE